MTNQDSSVGTLKNIKTMTATYGQLVDGKRITYEEFEKQVAKKLSYHPFLIKKKKDMKLCKTLYNKGYSVDDAYSLILLNN
jgi:SOS response regulatory protein OraA/RecX